MMKTKTMVICAVFAAVMCVFCVMTIPIGPVPISMATFIVTLTAIILGPKKGTVSVLIYILLGAVGLPVFSGFKGGIQILFGPTGGYIWSYIFMTLFIGALTQKYGTNKIITLIRIFIISLIGIIIICYGIGTIQFMAVQKVDFAKAFAACAAPFIVFDIIKAAVASYLGYVVRKALIKSNFLEEI
ncbi:MAG: biotin transporter BioY [Clostridia bacterium]|nr:biotin transporter BioY [Clostridia bacterium]